MSIKATNRARINESRQSVDDRYRAGPPALPAPRRWCDDPPRPRSRSPGGPPPNHDPPREEGETSRRRGRRHRREEGEGAQDEDRASSALEVEQGDTGAGPRVKLPGSGETSSARPSDNSAGKSSTPGASSTQHQTRAPRSAEEVQEHRARLEAEEAEDVAYVARRRARRAAEFARLAAEDRRREAPAGGEKEPAAGGKEKAP